ncbi:MAG: hypothetical protein ABIG89_03805 [Candidatus Woesearchaeota archaeon]
MKQKWLTNKELFDAVESAEKQNSKSTEFKTKKGECVYVKLLVPQYCDLECGILD